MTEQEGKVVKTKLVRLDGELRFLAAHRERKGFWPLKGTYTVDAHGAQDYGRCQPPGFISELPLGVVADSKKFKTGGSAIRAAKRELRESGRMVA